ncbi:MULTISPECIES: hypothetical protein [unclassified Pseudomonas]|uniref:hypothetical protein n=1 Tax=unclassified Pseudomonas TaxID=196821 RepID=UPI001EFCF816|nr:MULTISPECIES: hypothetical protein [unclassified Pseudomonas]
MPLAAPSFQRKRSFYGDIEGGLQETRQLKTHDKWPRKHELQYCSAKKTASWISDWSEAKSNQKKYVFGSYIETLYTVTGDSLLGAAKADPRFAKPSDETSPEQRQTIVDYVNTKRQTQWSGASAGRLPPPKCACAPAWGRCTHVTKT